ncbi:hypothetical protein [Mameliella alba]|nr:hypothetical protein [Mameliella alba]MBY6119967.1 hypothetical protein [Mameliella alba]
MKTLTILQAAALLMLAVIGAYAGQDAAAQPCATPQQLTAPAEACDL